MKIIVISGKQGSGKTTLSDGLAQSLRELNKEVRRVKFAEPLYEMQDAIAEVLTKYGEAMKVPDGPLLQLLGTEWGRTRLGQDIWTRILDRRIRRMPANAVVIVDDCRFVNELNLMYNMDGKTADVLTVRLEAGENARKLRAEKWRENTNHPSEIGLDDCVDQFDLTIDAEANDADMVRAMVLEKVLT